MWFCLLFISICAEIALNVTLNDEHSLQMAGSSVWVGIEVSTKVLRYYNDLLFL